MGDTYRNRSKANIRKLLLPPLDSLQSLNGFFTQGEKPTRKRRAYHQRIDDWSGFVKTPPPSRQRRKGKRRVLLPFTFGDSQKKREGKGNDHYSVSIVSNSNLISFQTSQAAANSGLHLQAARITSPPSRAKSRPSFRA